MNPDIGIDHNIPKLTLKAGAARLDILPQAGAGLSHLSVDGFDILRPRSGNQGDGPFSLSMNLLAPFSNRISKPFEVDGQRVALAPNLLGEAFPIHGNAFQMSWAIAKLSTNSARLVLGEGEFGPYRYSALVTYRLLPEAFEAELSVENRAGLALPYGLGFHPWFPRRRDTCLAFRASGVWLEDERHLPAGTAPVPLPEKWNFTQSRPLPPDWINNGFAGWDGAARIDHGPGFPRIDLTAEGLSTLMVYAPSADADFVCLEPVSHPVDAHNLPNRPGLVMLAPGERITGRMRLAWHV